LAGIFFDINYGDDNELGETLLQICCCNAQVGNIRLLVERGADVNARDNEGRTCLHTLAETARWPNPGLRSLESLVYLVKSGADVHAQDYFGVTVSEVAYSHFHGSSYSGDAWDVALAICGYDVESFRRGHRRQTWYTEQYSREVFEHLWTGIEHLCPYYDDEDWKDSDLSSESGSDDGGLSGDPPSKSETLPLSIETLLPGIGSREPAVETSLNAQCPRCGGQPTLISTGTLDTDCDNSVARRVLPTSPPDPETAWSGMERFSVDRAVFEAASTSGQADKFGLGEREIEEVFRNPWAVGD